MKTVLEFKDLKRDEMFEYLKEHLPELARGKSRAKRDDLVQIYMDWHLSQMKVGVDSAPEGSTDQSVMSDELVEDEDGQSDLSNAEVRLLAQLRETADPGVVYPAPTEMAASPVETGIEVSADSVGRRDEVVRALTALPMKNLRVLEQIKQLSQGHPNRQMRRIRAALAKQAQKFLPRNVTLMEAVALV